MRAIVLRAQSAVFALLAIPLQPALAQPQSSATLEAVKARGHLVCGVSQGTPGFSSVDDKGVWSGLDVEYCAALAAAVLGKKEAVKYRPLAAPERFASLKNGDVDVLARNTTWTLTRDTELGQRFAGVLLHDGHGFLVRRSHGVLSVLELSGASICVQQGALGEQAVHDYFVARRMRYQAVTAERWEEVVKAYVNGACTALAGEMTTLAHEKTRLSNPAEHQLLPELIAREPLGPVVRAGDEGWLAIVRWVLNALVAAEDQGITSANVEAMKASPVSEVRRILGVDGNPGQGLGLEKDWALQVVRQVGNYGEVLERTIGSKSALKLERRQNNLWSKGGLMFSPPFR